MSDDNDLELVSQPHDAFFKDVFSDLGHATAFFQEHLPGKIAARVGWESLTRVPGSFVKAQLLEEMLGEEATPGQELAELSLETLKARYAVLQSRYQAKFKNGG